MECHEAVSGCLVSPGVRPGDVSLTGLHPDHLVAAPGELLPQVAQAGANVHNSEGLGDLVLDKLGQARYFMNLFPTDTFLVSMAELVTLIIAVITLINVKVY